MYLSPRVKTFVKIAVSLTILYFLAENGYAGDHVGDYMNDQTPAMYSKATGWRDVVGKILMVLVFAYSAFQMWKSWRDR